MSALATGCDQVAHVRTQLPYALLGAAVAVVCGSLPVGLGLFGPWIAVPLGLLVSCGCLYLLGRNPTEARPS
jgi:Na+/H+ antiporter NhaC